MSSKRNLIRYALVAICLAVGWLYFLRADPTASGSTADSGESPAMPPTAAPSGWARSQDPPPARVEVQTSDQRLCGIVLSAMDGRPIAGADVLLGVPPPELGAWVTAANAVIPIRDRGVTSLRTCRDLERDAADRAGGSAADGVEPRGEGVHSIAITGRDGRFEMSRPAGRAVLLRVMAPGFADGHRWLPAEAGEEIQILLAKGSRLYGTLMWGDENGGTRPAAAQWLSLHDVERDQLWVVLTDEQGKWDACVSARAVVLHLVARGDVAMLWPNDPVLAGQEDAIRYCAPLPRVHVTDRMSGAPVASYALTVCSGAGTILAASQVRAPAGVAALCGPHELERIQARAAAFEVRAPGFATQRIHTEAWTRSSLHDVPLERGSDPALRIEVVRGCDPAQDARIRVAKLTPGQAVARGSGAILHEGTGPVRVLELPPGVYGVEIQAGDTDLRRRIEHREAATYRFDLSAVGSLQVACADGSFGEHGWERVRVMLEHGGVHWSDLEREQQSAIVQGIAPGRATVTVFRGNAWLGMGIPLRFQCSVDVPAGEVVPLPVPSVPAGLAPQPVAGILRVAGKPPGDGWRVRAGSVDPWLPIDPSGALPIDLRSRNGLQLVAPDKTEFEWWRRVLGTERPVVIDVLGPGAGEEAMTLDLAALSERWPVAAARVSVECGGSSFVATPVLSADAAACVRLPRSLWTGGSLDVIVEAGESTSLIVSIGKDRMLAGGRLRPACPDLAGMRSETAKARILRRGRTVAGASVTAVAVWPQPWGVLGVARAGSKGLADAEGRVYVEVERAPSLRWQAVWQDELGFFERAQATVPWSRDAVVVLD